MKFSTGSALALAATTALVAFVGLASGQYQHQSPTSTSAVGDAHRLHLEYTPSRTPTGADSARAATVAASARRAVEQYRDVHVAEAEGFRPFAPDVKQDVYHYTNWRYAAGERFRFDVAKPTSLLYRKSANGAMALVGVMYATSARASMDDLDARVPLSIARWHRHVNLCLPERGARDRWLEQRDGQPLFGPASPIATKAACDAVGGRFLPQLFGWMVHANIFAASPADVWKDEHASGHGDEAMVGHTH